MKTAVLLERPSAPQAAPGQRSNCNDDSLGRAAANLERSAHTYSRQPSRLSLWGLTAAAVDAAQALQAHARECESDHGVLAGLAASQPGMVANIERAWGDHPLAISQANDLVIAATGVQARDSTDPTVLLQRALLCARLIEAHRRRTNTLVFDWAFRDFGGEG